MPNNKTKKLFAFSALFFVSILFASCGVWTDFTTYFNTYYNARTLFDATEEAILKQNNDPFVFRKEEQTTQQRNVAQPNQPRPAVQPVPTTPGRTTPAASSGQINQDLIKVIERCSKILQFQQESSFFDDALFMTGKAFYYQNEYARAQRKFLELAALPETDYALENKLWLAKTYLQLRSFDEGLNLIEEVKTEAQKEENTELFSSASITKIGFLVYREEYANAITESQNFLKSIDDDELAALLLFQTGKIFLLQGDEENALQAFTSVLEKSPTFEIEFESRLQHALLLKETGKLDEGEAEFNELLQSGKFKNQTERIMVELGTIYYEKGDNEKAVSTFIEIDSTFRNTPSAGTASFMLGKIYEKKFGNYDSAFKYYSKTAVSLAPIENKTEASGHVKNIEKYFTIRKELNTNKTSLNYLNDPTNFIRDSIDYDLAYKEYQAEVEIKVDSMAAAVNSDLIANPNQRSVFQQQVQTLMQQNSVKQRNSGFITTPPTLKENIIQGKALKPQMPKIKEDSLRTLLSQNYYNLGSLFFSELEVPDSAYHYYKIILDEFADKNIRVQTLFAMGTYYETKSQKERADSLYQIIYDEFPNHPLYTESGIKLGKIKRDEKRVATGNTDPAEAAYIAAEEKYFKNDYRGAINGLTEVYLKYPKSEYLPKALFFIGMIYEENYKNYDSAAVYYSILSSKEYASTLYGKRIAPKYAEYKKAKELAEQEAQKKLIEEQMKEQKKLEEENKLQLNPVPNEATVKDSANIKINLKPEADEKKEVLKDILPKKDSLLSKEDMRKEAFKNAAEKQLPDSTKRKIDRE